MDTNNNLVIRCPKCGSVHLTGTFAETSGKGTVAKTLFLGIWGILWSFLGTFKKQKTYWRCNDCGYEFRM